jgi:hypothetical protein
MKIQSIITLAAALFMPGCVSQLLSPMAQGAFNTAAETVTEKILTSKPSELAALQKIAAALPGAFQGSITSAGIGQIMGQLGTQAGAQSSTTLDIAAAFDGALRNYTQQNGGTVPSLQGAIATQVLTNFADGMNHAIALYLGANPQAAPPAANPAPAAAGTPSPI